MPESYRRTGRLSSAPLHDEAGGGVTVLVGGDWGEEVARVGPAVGADRAALGKGEPAAIISHK